jgi:hypothetical protein
MGVSPVAILAYGYDLGGDEGGWNVEEADKYGELSLSWWDRDNDDEDLQCFREAATPLLVEAFGMDQKGILWGEDSLLPVKIITHNHIDFPMHIVATKHISAFSGIPRNLMDDFVPREQFIRMKWDADLRKACAALGITPIQEQPAWILASHLS